jgi:ribosomal protein S27AE
VRGRNFRGSRTQEQSASQVSLKKIFANTCSPSVMMAKWNKKLQASCGDKNSSLHRMNVGTSYFVAPYNHSTNQDIIKVVECN